MVLMLVVLDLEVLAWTGWFICPWMGESLGMGSGCFVVMFVKNSQEHELQSTLLSVSTTTSEVLFRWNMASV